MDALLGQFGEAIGVFFAQPTVRLVLDMAIGYVVVSMLGVAAVALFFSTLTTSSIGAFGGLGRVDL